MRFSIGDLVRVKPEALTQKAFGPAQLVHFGFPNRFTVISTQTVEAEGLGKVDSITLAECCGQIKDVETDQPLCSSHPEEMFALEKRDPLGLQGVKPECETAIDLPDLGRVFSLGHYRKEGASSIVLEVQGLKPLAFTGPLAELAAQQLKRLGLL
ncbi:MAG: hypothetical protein A3E01_10250 [Gammaproteobacteria bacterium RIFCSPHIGHO2_12_FULL_63_22]|nr:MAG: hypothetical protein A3E01_10250 [Gammaproteobacteria bacterium RIFCSPHIGHO2_12_FULL_63_22]